MKMTIMTYPLHALQPDCLDGRCKAASVVLMPVMVTVTATLPRILGDLVDHRPIMI